MPEPRSEWSLRASCAACRETFSLSSAAVLVRSSSHRPRGVLLDVLGERWPEEGRLLHSRCFDQQFGRPALWTSFLRGRLDKGVAPVRRSRKDSRVGEVVCADAAWLLSVECCDCSNPVEPSGPAVVRDEHFPQRWRWVPVLQERRPGQRRVYHLRCFVGSHGRSAAYGLLGLDLWDRTPKVVKRLAGMFNPLP